MFKLGVNSVLFKAFSFAEAARAIKLAGYDGVEVSAIKGMCEHLDLDGFNDCKQLIKDAADETGLSLLSTEVASLDRERLLLAFEACAELGIQVVNVGPGGKSDDEDSLKESLEALYDRAELAAKYGVTLCCKAHVGNSVYSTPTTLRMMEAIKLDSFGVNMDPSHIWRAGEEPAVALSQVVGRVRHIHFRDCKGREASPGLPAMQACGRGDIDLHGYFKVLVESGYEGPVSLEVIGPPLSITEAAVIAAESFGHVNAILKSL
ncbi:MAG: sugar phosphate isomerase/epimerase, partial [Defluviitaleaceae bacterium]|nr:sugar phosphate isomerase/epimerase [Defluviitaleaceae bacterium]